MNSHNAIISPKSENLTTFLYCNLIENVSQINPEVKDKDVCIATPQGRSHSKTD